MSIRKLKLIAMAFLLVSVLGGALIIVMYHNHDKMIAFAKEKEELKKLDSLELLEYYTEQIKLNKEISEFEQQLRIELPGGVSADDVEYKCNYIENTITIKIPTDDVDYFYDYPMIGKSDKLKDLSLAADGEYAVIEAYCDNVYEAVAEQIKGHKEYVYVDFVKPSDLYDKVVVIDAGHGDNDPGAVEDGTNEKDINLDIMLELKALLDEQDEIKVYYTRTDDSNPSLAQRVNLANGAGADYFISIHNNTMSYSSASYVNGTEVMYNENFEGDTNRSKELATLFADEVSSAFSSTNLGLEEGSSIYIIRTAKMPMALIEVGFMSNSAELAKLNEKIYQRKVALAMYDAIFKAYEQGV